MSYGSLLSEGTGHRSELLSAEFRAQSADIQIQRAECAKIFEMSKNCGGKSCYAVPDSYIFIFCCTLLGARSC